MLEQLKNSGSLRYFKNAELQQLIGDLSVAIYNINDRQRLETEIRAALQRTRETYGPKRLQSDLADHGIAASVDRIKRIRRKLGLRCKQKRKLKTTTDSRHPLPLAPNRQNRQFTVEAPNQA